MENNIKIVRFVDGLDVICEVLESSYDQIEMNYPMLFEMRGNKLLLDHWLPLAIMKGNSVKVHMKNILCTFEPNDEFSEYYIRAIERLSELPIQDNGINTEEEVNQLLEAFEEMEASKGLVIH